MLKYLSKKLVKLEGALKRETVAVVDKAPNSELATLQSVQGIAVEKEQLFYFPLPKVACTSIKKELYRLKKGKEYLNDNHRGRHIHQYFDSHLVNSQAYSRKVVIIRDPIKRFLSAFGNRVKYHCETHEKAIKKNNPKLVGKLPFYNPNLGQFIEHFDDYLQVESIAHHCKLVSDWLDDDLSLFTDVIPLEKLNVFEQILSDTFNEQVTFPREQTGGPKIPLHRLNRVQLDKLLVHYQRDYDLLSAHYTPDAIIQEWKDAKRSHRNQNKK